MKFNDFLQQELNEGSKLKVKDVQSGVFQDFWGFIEDNEHLKFTVSKTGRFKDLPAKLKKWLAVDTGVSVKEFSDTADANSDRLQYNADPVNKIEMVVIPYFGGDVHWIFFDGEPIAYDDNIAGVTWIPVELTTSLKKILDPMSDPEQLAQKMAELSVEMFGSAGEETQIWYDPKTKTIMVDWPHWFQKATSQVMAIGKELGIPMTVNHTEITGKHTALTVKPKGK